MLAVISLACTVYLYLFDVSPLGTCCIYPYMMEFNSILYEVQCFLFSFSSTRILIWQGGLGFDSRGNATRQIEPHVKPEPQRIEPAERKTRRGKIALLKLWSTPHLGSARQDSKLSGPFFLLGRKLGHAAITHLDRVLPGSLLSGLNHPIFKKIDPNGLTKINKSSS